MFERTSYLSRKAFDFYFLATVLSVLSSNAGLILIGIIVGQLMGPEGLSVINLAFPLVQVIYTLSLFVNLGSAIMSSFCIGRSEHRLAKEYFTMAMLFNVVLGALFVLLGCFCSMEVSQLLCAEPSLLPMLNTYVKITLLSTPLLLLIPGLTMFVRVSGAPKFSAFVLLLVNLLSLVLAYVFIKYLNWGIAGASLSVVVGYVVAIVVFLPRFLKSSSIISFVCPSGKTDLKAAFVTSLPSAMLAALTAFRLFAINFIISKHLGLFGIEILGVVLNLHVLATIFTTGAAQSLQPVGAFMLGQYDYLGFKYIVQRSFRVLLGILSVCVLFFGLFPELVLNVFGFELTERLAEAKNIVRIVSFNYFLFAVNYQLMTVYQVFRRNKLSITISLIQPLAIVPFMLLLGQYAVSYIWMSFIIGELCVLSFILIATWVIKRREGHVSRMLLLPTDALSKQLNMTLAADKLGFASQVLENITSFLRNAGVDDTLVKRANTCCEEMLQCIKQHVVVSQKNHCIDLHILIHEGELRMNVCDNSPEIKMLPNTFTDSVDYKRVNGQNQLSLCLV